MSDVNLFKIENDTAKEILDLSKDKLDERELQHFIANNLFTFLRVWLLENEYRIDHGRIDTLGIDENNRPTIIEYKVRENFCTDQIVSYWSILKNSRGKFLDLVKDKFDDKTASKVEWSNPRLIGIAPGFSRKVVDAVKLKHPDIELIRYRKYEKDLWLFELVATGSPQKSEKTITREAHSNPQLIRLKEELREFLLDLSNNVQEKELKSYYAYKVTRNFALVPKRKNKLLVCVKINLDGFSFENGFTRDLRKGTPYGVSNLEITIGSDKDFENATRWIKESYDAS